MEKAVTTHDSSGIYPSSGADLVAMIKDIKSRCRIPVNLDPGRSTPPTDSIIPRETECSCSGHLSEPLLLSKEGRILDTKGYTQGRGSLS